MDLTDPNLARILEREHAAAKRQRRGPPASDLLVPDFRSSERHRTRYLAVGPDQGRFLNALVLATGARGIVEFGTSFGISTLYLAAAAERTGGGIVGTEYHAEKARKARETLAEARLDAEIRIGDARETLEGMEGPIGLLFLDGAKELYGAILDILAPALSPRAVIVADNVDPDKSELKAFLAAISGPGFVTTYPRFAKGGMSLSVRSG